MAWKWISGGWKDLLSQRNNDFARHHHFYHVDHLPADRIEQLITFQNPRFEVWTGTITMIQVTRGLALARGFSAVYVPGMEAGRYTQLSDMGASAHAHNTLLQTAVTIGIPMAFVIALLAGRKAFVATSPAIPVAWSLGMAIFGVFIFGGLTEDYLGLTTMRSFFFTTLGVALGIAQLPSPSDTKEQTISSEIAHDRAHNCIHYCA